MSIQNPKSTASYSNDILTTLANSGITQLAPGGKARAFADIVADKLSESEARQYGNITQSLLPYATKDSLDLIGEIYGVTRIGRQDSSVTTSDQNFEFYVRSGTFGDINNGQDISIPAGVQLTSIAPNGPIFVTDATVLSALDNIAFVSASSRVPGAAGNVSSGIISTHNFTGYAESRFSTLLITNNFGIVGGRDTETDDQYRFRINLKIQSQAGANQSAIRLAILQVPGIQDVVFQSQAGSFLVYVYSISVEVSSTLLQLVQNQINNNAAYPLIGTAIAPDLVGISLNTSISFVQGISSVDEISIVATARTAAEAYINNLSIGQELVINKIADQILNSDNRILDIGQPDNPIEKIFIWRSRADTTRYSRTLTQNYPPSVGERIIVENSISTPINLVVR